MTVYIDVIFIENLFMNYIIILATGIISKIKINHLRLIIASSIGAIYSVIAFMPGSEDKSGILIKIVLSIFIILIAYTPKNIKKFISQLMIFYLTSFAFGGCAFFLVYVIKPENVFSIEGVLVGNYPIKIAMLGGIIGFGIIIYSFKNIKNKINKKDIFCDIEININNNKETIRVMIDTGNMLKDPISKQSVIVVEAEKLEKLIPKLVVKNISGILGGDENEVLEKLPEEYSSKIRIIPFSSIGKKHGMILGIKADNIKIIEEEKIIKNVIVGIYDGKIGKSYSGLLGIDILEKEGNNNEYAKNIEI